MFKIYLKIPQNASLNFIFYLHLCISICFVLFPEAATNADVQHFSPIPCSHSSPDQKLGIGKGIGKARELRNQTQRPKQNQGQQQLHWL